MNELIEALLIFKWHFAFLIVAFLVANWYVRRTDARR